MSNESLNNPDVNNTDPKYWEKVLHGHNLDMSRGRRRSDDFAEATYCEDRARRLQEEGQVLPTESEVSGSSIFEQEESSEENE